MESLLGWNTKQGKILTGGGVLEKLSLPKRDFNDSDLPHFHLKDRSTKKTFKEWRANNKTSAAIIGAWSRPIFSGGYCESTASDTDAYNLQTPSIFIDMRFPRCRPTILLRSRKALSNCSDEELRYLSRQHCFSGYSFPEDPSACSPQVFTRHHVIDWNYHPYHPRSRPNRWFIQVEEVPKESKGSNDAMSSSFKEYSTIRDADQVPLYYERWARILPIAKQSSKYLAIRRIRECPIAAAAAGRKPERDAIFVVVGNHFALAVDRDYTSLMWHYERYSKVAVLNPCKGGGGSFIDYILDKDNNIESRREVAEEYLNLEGSYGQIVPYKATPGTMQYSWKITQSTHPWKEGSSVFESGDISVSYENIGQTTVKPVSIDWKEYGQFEVLECSFSPKELEMLFQKKAPVPHYKSKL